MHKFPAPIELASNTAQALYSHLAIQITGALRKGKREYMLPTVVAECIIDHLIFDLQKAGWLVEKVKDSETDIVAVLKITSQIEDLE